MSDEDRTDQVRDRLLRGETIENPVIRPGDDDIALMWEHIHRIERRLDAMEKGSTYLIPEKP